MIFRQDASMASRDSMVDGGDNKVAYHGSTFSASLQLDQQQGYKTSSTNKATPQ